MEQISLGRHNQWAPAFWWEKILNYQIKKDGITPPSKPSYEIQEDSFGKMGLRVGGEYGTYIPESEHFTPFRFENELGFFSEAAFYSFQIKPSMIQAWWFKAILGLLFLGFVVLIYQKHVNRILAVVKLRSRLARDLRDDRGSTLRTINILSSMAKTKLVTDPAKTSDCISKISKNSQRMMEAMDDIV